MIQTADVAKDVRALSAMTATALRERYRKVFGEETRSGNRRWLERRIAWRIQSQAEGGLSVRANRLAEELARDEDLRVRPPRETRAGQAAGARAGGTPGRDRRLPMPGTVLTRRHGGVEHRVHIHDDAFEYDGRRYRSLSAIAHAITGSHWNGFHFFGLGRGASK